MRVSRIERTAKSISDTQEELLGWKPPAGWKFEDWQQHAGSLMGLADATETLDVVVAFRAGEALVKVREFYETSMDDNFTRWLSRSGRSRSTAYRRIAVYDGADRDIEAARRHGVMELVERAKGKKSDRSQKPSPPPSPPPPPRQSPPTRKESHPKETHPKEAFVRRLEEEFGITMAEEPQQVQYVTARLLALLSEQEGRAGTEVLDLAVKDYFMRHGKVPLDRRTEARRRDPAQAASSS